MAGRSDFIAPNISMRWPPVICRYHIICIYPRRWKETTTYLGIQLILLRDLANGNESLWGDFPRSDTRDNAKRPIPLNISQVPVVGVLVLMMLRLHHVLVISI